MTIESIELLADFKDKLNKVVNFFRSKTVTSIIQLVYLSFCPTRWTNFTEIMMFFINKADVITTFLKEYYNLVQKYLSIIYPMQINFEMFIFQDISALYWLLIPFKSFINTIESGFSPIAYLYPVFENFISTNDPDLDSGGIRNCPSYSIFFKMVPFYH